MTPITDYPNIIQFRQAATPAPATRRQRHPRQHRREPENHPRHAAWLRCLMQFVEADMPYIEKVQAIHDISNAELRVMGVLKNGDLFR